MKDNVLQWLINSYPWVELRTRIDILDEDEDNPEVVRAYEETVNHPLIASILKELANCKESTVSSHKNAGQSYHKLAFLAEIGIKKDNAMMQTAIGKFLANRSKEGLVSLPMEISESYGGTGKQTYAWALCDAPLLLYSMFKLKTFDKDALNGVSFLINLAADKGWPCKVSENLGKFRGPGKKSDPCPYATLLMLKLLAEIPELKESNQTKTGVESILTLFDNSKSEHPYMFYMGNDFRKLKFPFIWYDILHTSEILSKFPYAISDERFLKMWNMIKEKSMGGKFTPESEWKAWSSWDFSNKKEPSPTLTWAVARIEKRIDKNNINNN